MGLFEELKRRNVFRVGIAYGVASWLVLQVADIVLEALAAPEWVMKALLALLLIGLPIALLFAWAFEVTPEGIKRESEVDRTQSITSQTGRRLDFAIIVVLVLALGYFVVDKFVLRPEAGPPADRATADAAPDATPDATADASETAAGPAPEKSIAVLPFVNLSSDPEQEFFSDGISEELLNVLAQYPDLRVAARTSSFQFKGQNQDVGEIARLLKVKHILEGSVRKAGNQLRITAQLIEADNGYHLWSQTYDRELKDVFAIQDEISAAIGDALRVELALGGDEADTVPRVAESDNTAAYEAFLKGRNLIAQRGRKNITEGVAQLERAVRLDPDYAPSHAWLAIGISLLLNSPSSYGDYTLAEVQELAVPHLDRAMALQPDLAAAWGAKALMAGQAGEVEAAIAAANRAVELNPVFVDALNWGAQASGAAGDYAGALAKTESLVEVDPLSVVGRLNYIFWKCRSEPGRTRQLAEELTEQSPWAGYLSLGILEACNSSPDLSTALTWTLRSYRESPLDDFSNRQLIFLFASVGEFDEARRVSDMSAYLADVYQGRHETALDKVRARFEQDPENQEAKVRLADAYYLAGRWDEAQALYLSLRELTPSGMVTGGDHFSISHARMVQTLVSSDQQELAAAAAADLDRMVTELGKLGVASPWDHMAEAIMAASLGDQERALLALRHSRESGMWEPLYFDDPAFEALRSNPEFLTLRAEVNQLLEREHDEMLQVMCFDNPIPDTWEPLDRTCIGVTPST